MKAEYLILLRLRKFYDDQSKWRTSGSRSNTLLHSERRLPSPVIYVAQPSERYNHLWTESGSVVPRKLLVHVCRYYPTGWMQHHGSCERDCHRYRPFSRRHCVKNALCGIPMQFSLFYIIVCFKIIMSFNWHTKIGGSFDLA